MECGINWCNKSYDDDDDDGDDDDEHNDDENDDVQEEEEEEDNDVEDDDVEEDGRSDDRDPHFVWACAIDMHMNVSQVTRALSYSVSLETRLREQDFPICKLPSMDQYCRTRRRRQFQRMTTLHSTTLRYAALHYTTLHYTTLHWMTLHHR